MAKTSGSLRKNIFREMRSTLGRFIAIFAISALGAGFFAGLKATSPDMIATADHYYRQQRLMDVRLLSTLGFTEDDIAVLQAQPGVQDVMAGWGMDVLMRHGEATEPARLLSLPGDTGGDNPAYLNRPVLEAGRLPVAPDECLADTVSGLAVGDVVRVADDNADGVFEQMARTEFTVTGLATSPSYVSFLRGNTNIGNGKLAYFLYLTPQAFDSEVYTEVFLTLEGAGEVSGFSAQYEALVDAGVDDLEALARTREQVRYDEVFGEAEAELADARAEWEDARAEADEKLAEAWQEILDGEAELADGWATYNESAQKLADGEAELADGQAKLDDARAQLWEGEAGYNDGRAKLDAGFAEYQANKDALDGLSAGLSGMGPLVQVLDGLIAAPWGGSQPEIDAFTQAATPVLQTAGGVARVMMQSGDASVQAAGTALQGAVANADAALAGGDCPAAYNFIKTGIEPYQPVMAAVVQAGQNALVPVKAQLDESDAQLAAARAELDWNWKLLHTNTMDLQQAQAEIADGYAELADARIELEDAGQTLADGRAEYEGEKADAERELADAKAEIDDAQAQLDEVEQPKWYVRTRDDNPGYSGFASDTQRIDAIAVVIPVFFFLVALLVCLTTMTRMVEEQRGLIGTMKALGYGRGAIAFKYLLYAATASTTGAIAGVAIGFVLFPTAIWNAYRILYLMPALRVGNSPWLIVASVAMCVLTTTLATLLACFNELRTVPAGLMRPKAPRAGKRVLLERIRPLWRRLGFMAKVTVRNLFRYKKRFFMTVIGVAGCTALLLTGFGLRDSITGIVTRQYGGINQYDVVVALSDPVVPGEDAELDGEIDRLGQGLYVSETLIDARSDKGNNIGMTTYLFVAQDSAGMDEYIRLVDRKTQQPLEYPETGVIITEKLASKLGLGAGDSFEVNRVNEDPVALTVAAVAENYIFNYVYISAQEYADLFGGEPGYDQILLNLDPALDMDDDAAVESLLEVGAVAGAVHIASLTEQFNDMFASLDAVVILIIAAAGLLAFVVLYNLTNINITERAREIATLKVLGFYNGEVASYVYRENLLLTLIGIAAGFALGVVLHDFVITTAEIDEVMFRRVIEPLSYLWSVLFTLLCAGLVNLVMLRRLRKVDMIESLKSTE